MKTAILYTDIISPYGYLLDALLRRDPLPLEITMRPVLFAGMLDAIGGKGPAEIPSKRIFTYEFCTWFAASRGIPFRMPALHPFNPLRYLRLILALGSRPEVVSIVFDALFSAGADPEAESTWQELLGRLGLTDASSLIETPAVKQELRRNTDEALAAGVFGVPTLLVDGHLFWGVDALPMLADYLAEPRIMETPAMQAARQIPMGTTRSASR